MADTDHRAMVQFGESTVRLAESARQSGHAAEAVSELWPLVARLEARVEDGHTERDVLHLLARARVGLGVALGNVLPEERLSTAARWTAKSLDLVEYFEEPALTSYALRMHGNELRKARLAGAAVERLCRAAALAPDNDSRAAALPLLARAAGALGNAELFGRVMRETEDLLSSVDHTSLFNPFSLHEIRLRGLIATGQVDTAIRLVEHSPVLTTTVAPQWRVIELVTVAHVQLLADDRGGAEESLDVAPLPIRAPSRLTATLPRTTTVLGPLSAGVGHQVERPESSTQKTIAVQEAVVQRLPHQLQRIMRTATGRLPEIHDTAAQALDHMRCEMAA
ncbi:hypothetical protein ABZ192_29830 [Streptomyces sp. NPDC006235]|uniref:hypothetical protein n=1 Tax=Streptomyces sp. NPDC006235 TaxID=3156736 RepID=UPI0033A5434B